jgi:hypothetical protein
LSCCVVCLFSIGGNVPGLGEVGFMVGHAGRETPPCLARVTGSQFSLRIGN